MGLDLVREAVDQIFDQEIIAKPYPGILRKFATENLFLEFDKSLSPDLALLCRWS